MFDFLSRLLDADGFAMRHDAWAATPEMVWLDDVADVLIWLAYLAVPFVLVYFIRRRRGLPYPWILGLFGVFILCGSFTHLMEVILNYTPVYRLAALVKLITAVASWATVAALVPLMPRALAMRGPEVLQGEVDARMRAEEALRKANAELERRVAKRTAELERANVALQAEVRGRQRVEESLRREREWFRVTLASIGDAVIVTDTRGRIQFLNPVAQEMVGWPGAEAVGQPLTGVFRILDEETHRPVLNPVERVLGEGSVGGLANQTLLTGRDGRERPVEASAAPIRDQHGTILGVVLTFRDISERRRADEALRAGERELRLALEACSRLNGELQEADRRKDEFLAMLAHELRNPMAPIRNALFVLRMPAADTAVQAQARDLIERQVLHMVRLVDDLLDVSRIMRGKIGIHRERVDLAAVVARAVETAQPHLEGQRHRLTVALLEAPLALDADPIRLAQVIANLLNNAAKYTPPGGQVTLSAEDQGREVVLRVRDTGIGIAPELLPRVFDLFTQADQSLARSHGGLGIGLTLVRRLVELHGGTVEAHSEGRGQGSEFVVRLPLPKEEGRRMKDDSENTSHDGADLKDQADAEPVHPSSFLLPPSKRRVLVVDDNEDAAESLAIALRLSGHQVRVAHDGPAGLRAAQEHRPEVVFLDIGMPGMDGYEVARRLRQQPGGGDAMLVAVTGWGQEADRRRSHEVGFDRHLVKPVDVDALHRLLERPIR
jgi:PAS domain S-box-containing protein